MKARESALIDLLHHLAGAERENAWLHRDGSLLSCELLAITASGMNNTVISAGLLCL
jgi:hypothetical protein